MVKQNQPDIAEMKAGSPKYAQSKIMMRGFKQVGELQNAIEAIYSDESMTAEEKRIEIDSLKVDLNEIYKSYVKALQ